MLELEDYDRCCVRDAEASETTARGKGTQKNAVRGSSRRLPKPEKARIGYPEQKLALITRQQLSARKPSPRKSITSRTFPRRPQP